jgi:hypothetical protein
MLNQTAFAYPSFTSQKETSTYALSGVSQGLLKRFQF